MITVYKIRDNATGLFSSGGSIPHWKKLGKVWKQKGHVSNHLNGVKYYHFRYPPTAEIVEYEIIENEAGTYSVRAIKDAAYNKRMASYRAEQARRALERAQAEVDRLKNEVKKQESL